ncbi:2718_t:CDS:2, partial [Acaulospora morrowiae]
MDVDEISTITINTDYAKKYEERKRNEELSKLKEKYGDVKLDSSEDESTSEEEDEFGELVTPEVDAQIMKTIAAIRSKDPKLYDSQSSFFADEEVQKARQRWTYKQQEKKSEGKPVHLKDYHRQLLLENGGVIDETDTKSETTINLKDRNRQNDDISNEEDQKVDKPEKKKVWLTTLEEEQKLKNEFNAVVSEFGFATEVEDNDDFLVQ